MKGCPLVAPTFATDRTLCDYCGGPLPTIKNGPRKGQVASGRRWCSPECSTTYWSNHQWSLTRAAALKRDDYRCVRCGSEAGTERGTCVVCREPWPCNMAGQKGTRYYTGWVHREDVRPGALEVNHVEPRKGMGYQNGCHHHLEGVETLCRPCHVQVTTQQLREWRPPRPPAGAARRESPPEAVPLPLWAGESTAG